MPRGYIQSQTSVHFMNYHFVWCPKYRKSVLVNDIASRMEELIYQKAKDLSSEVITLTIQPDHTHLFIRAHPRISPNTLIGQIKGYTSRILRQEFPEIKRKLPTLWTRSYFVSTHGHISDKMIQKYIDEQRGV